MTKQMKISDEAHRLLTVILGELTARYGKVKTYDDVIKELINSYRAKQTEEVQVV